MASRPRARACRTARAPSGYSRRRALHRDDEMAALAAGHAGISGSNDGLGHAPAFGVYVHWPFCLSKCPYCDFNSHVRHAAVDEARFLRGFLTEIAASAERVPGRTVTSVFFGGGTPSL